MKKSDIVKRMIARGALSRNAAEEFVNLMFDAMIAALVREERIAIRNFGNFTVRHIRAGISHNPKTGEKIMLPERRFPFFKAGKDLLQRINNR